MCVLSQLLLILFVHLRLTANSSLFPLFEILRLRLTTGTDCVNPVPDTCQASTVWLHLVDQQVMQVKSQVTMALVKLTLLSSCPWGDGCGKSSGVHSHSAGLGGIWSRATLMWQLPSISVTASGWPQSLGSGHWQVMGLFEKFHLTCSKAGYSLVCSPNEKETWAPITNLCTPTIWIFTLHKFDLGCAQCMTCLRHWLGSLAPKQPH